MSERSNRSGRGVAAGLIVFGIAARIVPHPWNATPVTAIALFGGTSLPRRWAVAVPLVIVALSDFVIGWHATIPFTWGAFALTALLGLWLRRNPSPSRILGATLLGSSLFFIISNFGVWVTSSLYPKTAPGLWQCYVAGLPFFRTMLLGDLLYTTLFFGAYALLTNSPRIRHATRVG